MLGTAHQGTVLTPARHEECAVRDKGSGHAPGNISRIKSTLKLTPKAKIIPLQIPQIEGLPPGLDSTSDMTPAMTELLKQALDLMQPQIATLLSQLKPHFVFFDFAQHWLPKLASQLKIKTLKFSVFSAVSGAFVMVPARKNNHTIDDIMKPPNGFPETRITSLKEFEARDFLYVFKSFHGNPSVYERAIECNNSSTAIISEVVNSMKDLIDYSRELETGPHDVIVARNYPSFISQLIQQLNKKFALKDSGQLHYFLGLEVKHFSSGLMISQTKYTHDLLTKAYMLDSSKINNPIAQKSNPLPDDNKLTD
ncbi:hypothetical protein LWI28_008838 [Acer negundo]|uniref:Reverse transcriptase Ty1/copia-type domain-containing protein n=1 Tax=Acer negundo TaxID=4023 RepID=A0AAD5P5Q6_ACENE|nr:hypothetical protein LWI28_008838 [Acer negundo]